MYWECLFSLRDSCARFVDKFRSFLLVPGSLQLQHIYFSHQLSLLLPSESSWTETQVIVWWPFPESWLFWTSDDYDWWEFVTSELHKRWRLCLLLSWYWIRLGPSSKLIDEFLQIMWKHVDRNAFPLLCTIQSHSTVSSVTSSQADLLTNLVCLQ